MGSNNIHVYMYAYVFWIIVSDLPWMLHCLCDCVTVISCEGLLYAFRGNSTMQASFLAFHQVECNCSLPWLKGLTFDIVKASALMTWTPEYPSKIF